MVLKSLLLVVALASSAIAQGETSDTPIIPDPATTTMMAPTPMPTMVPVEPAPLFENVSAETIQRDHFFCMGDGSTRRDFLTTPTGNLMNSEWPYRWGLWIQFPVLSYLDTMRKRHLFYVISQMVADGGAQLEDGLFNRMCIAEVEQYGVSTYRESVFVKLYDNVTDDELRTLQDIDRAFRTSYTRSGNPYVTPFLGRNAININATSPSMGPRLADRTVNDSVHPGCDIESCPEGDPTLLAVVIGTYVGRGYYGMYMREEYPEEVTVETLERLESGSISDVDGTYYPLNEFAENPRPINYGLEAGDIVFAVFGSIFLTILAGAIILGYVIHPFFLA